MKPRTGRLQQHPLAIQRTVVIVQMAVDVFLERKCPVYLPPHEGAVRDMESVAHEQVLLVAQRDRFGHELPAFDICEVLSPVPAAESRSDLAVVAFGCSPCEVDGVEGAAAAKGFGGRVTAVDVWELGVGSRGGWGGCWGEAFGVLLLLLLLCVMEEEREIAMASTNIVLVMVVKSNCFLLGKW